MIFPWQRKQEQLPTSSLYDEKTFYAAFFEDLYSCKSEVIIESPYITSARVYLLKPIFQKLIMHEVKICIITRNPQEHGERLAQQAAKELEEFDMMGVEIILCSGNHHRKLAIVDRKILWEGSLNILSQGYSLEIMRRIESKTLTQEMFNFLELNMVL